MEISKRKLLMLGKDTIVVGAGFLSLDFLAACSVTQGPTGPMVTLNVKTVDLWGKAVVAFTGTVLGLVAPATALVINPILATVEAGIASFDAETNGQVSISINTTSIPEEISSILNGGQSIFDDAKAALPAPSVALQNTLDAMDTILTLFQAALSTSLVAAAKPLKMTQVAALAVLGVK